MSALTTTPWIATLNHICRYSDDFTARTLARMLREIIETTPTRRIDQILDRYALDMLERQP